MMIGIAGRPGSGNASFMVDLVRELVSRGLTVSTIMGGHGATAIDRPGKDSFRHRDAGAEEVMVTSAQRWALIHGGAATEQDPLARMAAVDVVLTDERGDPAVQDEIDSGDAPAVADFIVAQLGLA